MGLLVQLGQFENDCREAIVEFFEVIEDYGYGDANHWGYFQNRENAEAKAAELIQRYWDEYPADYVPLIIHRVKILTHSMTD